MGRGMAIGLGVVAGGLLGAAARPAVVYAFWLRGSDADTVGALVLASAGIGMTVGVSATLIAAPVRGAWVSSLVGALGGASLAYLATVVTFLPLFFVGLLGFNGVQVVDDEAPLYGVAMAATGALSGSGGAVLQGRLRGRRPMTASGS